MENELIDNDEEEGIYIKEINGKKCLHYKLDYEGIKFLKEPKFLKWLNSQKKEIGKKDYLYMCKHCNIFIYPEIHNFKCCFYSSYDPICLCCGSIFHGNSYCCPKRGLIEVSQMYILDGRYTCNLREGDGVIECLKSIPLIFNLVSIGTVYFGLFLHRRYKDGKSGCSCYETKGTKCSNIAINIGFGFVLILSLVYFIPFIIIYFIYLLYSSFQFYL